MISGQLAAPPKPTRSACLTAAPWPLPTARPSLVLKPLQQGTVRHRSGPVLRGQHLLPTISTVGKTLRTSHIPPLSRSDLVHWHKSAVSICDVMSAAGES